MEKLSMCRVCLGEDIQLHSIVKTHLQEMYESLVLIPLETKDGRPQLACYICYARLENCYELRKSCLQSEELLTQMLSNNESEQVKLQRLNNKKRLTTHNAVHLSIGNVPEMKSNNAGVEALKCEVKLEASDAEDIDENALEENSDFDNVQSADSDDDFVITVKEEQTGERTGDPTLKETTQDDLTNPEDLTFSNLKDHELVQDTSQVAYKFTAADVTAVTSTNEETFTLANDNKERPTSVPRRERVKYTCDTCQQCYSSKCELERHIRLCSDAWKTDLSRENSTSTYTHTAEKPFECTVCKKQYSSERYLTIHMRTHTGEKLFGCTVCNKSFVKMNILIRHMRTHTGEKPYQCDICKKKFSQKNYIKDHMRIHSGVKPYQCNECKKRFSRKGCLSIHMRTHTGEKPYQCDICKKRFSLKISIITHMRTHMGTHIGKKPYQCNLCKKILSRIDHLRQHMYTHTGEKPYECNICQKQFSQKYHLKRHMRTHTGGKPHHCGICKKQFSQKYNLLIHMRTHTDV